MTNEELSKFWENRPAKPQTNTPVPPRVQQPTPPATPPGPANPFNKPAQTKQPVAPSYNSGNIRESETKVREVILDELLIKMIKEGGSDLHLSNGLPPMMRKHGELEPIEGFSPLSSQQIRTMVFAIMSQEKQATYLREHEMDLAHSIPNVSRFRVNVLQARGSVGCVIRVIPNEIKTLAQLGMPEGLAEFATLPRGLVLVTGPTGSGKSTTLAAIIDAANKTRKDHILTIEDPIEFVHQNQQSVITQREIGEDTKTFPEALKRALRQDPDIILVGEMRDPETIGIAITAAETGHLVFGTLHTQSAAETMSRIIDSFPDGSKEQIRAQLAATVQGIVCQTLLKTLDGRGRVAAMEILKGDPAVRALIRKGQEQQIRSALETGGKKGMQTMDQSLANLVKANKVQVDLAAQKSTNPEQFYQSLGGEVEVNKIRRRQAEHGGAKV